MPVNLCMAGLTLHLNWFIRLQR